MTSGEVITILLTIIFGIPAYLALRKAVFSKLILVVDEEINLYSSISKNIPDLEVTYRKTKIGGNSFLIKACFIYQGRKDITRDQIVKELYIEFSPNTIIHDFHILDSSKDLNSSYEITENKIQFSFDLLKNEDYIYFQVFIVSPANSKYSIAPNHRIANLGNIKKIHFIPYNMKVDILLFLLPALALTNEAYPIIRLVVTG